MTDEDPEPGFVTRRIGHDTIVVPLASGVGDLNAVYTLNEPGAAIWQMVRTGLAVPEIVAAVCRDYDVSAETATQDILDLIAELRDAGLLDATAATGA